MFSINHKPTKRGDGIVMLYIPLCFLLIKHCRKDLPTPHQSLHSTMFSINRSSLVTADGSMLALHSTMFSINLEGDSNYQTDGSALHSTMFSINPGLPAGDSICRGWLYIPLCFLLIAGGDRASGWSDLLYIPLCFLLITHRRNWSGCSGSLYIPLCFLLIDLWDCEIGPHWIFTFHYVFY